MMQRIFGLAVIVSLMIIFSADAYAQKLGGYKEIPKTDPAAKAAAEFAVSAEAEKTGKSVEFVAIHKAERQTVAGANYRLCIKVTTQGEKNEADVTHFVKVVVYQNLKQEYKLASWETSDCGEEDDD